ncbi:hypothetical protein KAJ89_02945 [Candidatus Parcubacteria bacterium]|nr:hypothetical protein [Candidatus Parcubacteria bacterium]
MEKSRFIKIYSNLPIRLRDEIVLVVNYQDKKQPITWNVAYVEISNNTELGKTIYNELIKMEII